MYQKVEMGCPNKSFCISFFGLFLLKTPRCLLVKVSIVRSIDESSIIKQRNDNKISIHKKPSHDQSKWEQKKTTKFYLFVCHFFFSFSNIGSEALLQKMPHASSHKGCRSRHWKKIYLKISSSNMWHRGLVG